MADPGRGERVEPVVRVPVAPSFGNVARLAKLSGCITGPRFPIGRGKARRTRQGTRPRVRAYQVSNDVLGGLVPISQASFHVSRGGTRALVPVRKTAGIRLYRAPATSPVRRTVGPGAGFWVGRITRSIHRPRAAPNGPAFQITRSPRNSHIHLMTGAKSSWYSARRNPRPSLLAAALSGPAPDARWHPHTLGGQRVAFVDKTLVCSDCGAEFTFTAGEQEFHHSKGFSNEPRRCANCRRARKAADGGTSFSARPPREMFSVTCASCGKDAKVPFEPRGDRPVYCSDCFQPQPRSVGGGGYGGGAPRTGGGGYGGGSSSGYGGGGVPAAEVTGAATTNARTAVATTTAANVATAAIAGVSRPAGVSSHPAVSSTRCGLVAQRGEQPAHNRSVLGSNPGEPTIPAHRRGCVREAALRSPRGLSIVAAMSARPNTIELAPSGAPSRSRSR